jgi:hypothetical protein
MAFLVIAALVLALSAAPAALAQADKLLVPGLFEANGGSPTNNVDNLDADHDGQACEAFDYGGGGGSGGTGGGGTGGNDGDLPFTGPNNTLLSAGTALLVAGLALVMTSPTPLPRLAPPRSPSSPARPPWSSSAGQPTPAPATPWASSPTTAATLPLGSPPVPASPPARQAPPPGHPHPDTRLATGHLGLLAYRPALRHQPPPRRTTPGPRTHSLGLTQGTRDRRLWHVDGTAGENEDGSHLARWSNSAGGEARPWRPLHR